MTVGHENEGSPVFAPQKETKRKIRLTIAYDGTDLRGWQRQQNGPTVQQHVEEAVAEIAGTATPVTGASRTDSGVHAHGQVCHFETFSTAPLEAFRAGVNSKLPRAIAITQAHVVPENFHARFHAVGKHYRYSVYNRTVRCPINLRYSWHVRPPLNLAAMRDAAAAMVGTQDFSAFRAADCQAKSPVREVTRVDIVEEKHLVTVEVFGRSFLRNMVRIMAGTLVECGLGQIDPHSMGQIISSLDRRQAGQTAPAHGLTLMSVSYA